MAGAKKTITIDPENLGHYCIQAEKIQAIYEFIHGNGEEGMKTTVKVMNTNLTNIKDAVNGLTQKYDKSLEETGKVKSAFEKYQAELIGAEKQQQKIDALEEKKKLHRRWIVGLVITVMLTLTGLIFTAIKLSHDEGKLKQQNTIENIGKK